MNSAKNSISFLKEVYELLETADIPVWIFGGWAEELQGIIESRPHKDIDLLYVGKDFEIVDDFLELNQCDIRKKFPHKRAFLYHGVLIEIFLVTKEGDRYITNFFNTYKHQWPISTFDEYTKEFRVCSIETLHDYRAKHVFVEQARSFDKS